MLLNEFLKAQCKIETQEATITQLKASDAMQEALIAQQQKDFASAIAKQQREMKALTSQIQKVSARLEATKSAPRVAVVNKP
jgi:predicted  nucleic acid-binding Zn-ribbon protein